MLRIILASILVMLASAAQAASPPTPTEKAAPQQATRIETDPKTGAIRFIVDGKEQARIDATGLHVRQDVEYGGAITDTNNADYDAAAGRKP